MRKRTAAELKRRTGADMRAQRDQRLGASGPRAEASKRAQSIRDGLNKFADAIEEMADAYNRDDWKTLGYASWQDYCRAEFSPERVRLTAEQRRQAAASLASAGLTKRAAAAALGVSHTTIQKDASGNKLPLGVIEGQVKTDAEVADEVAQATASFDEKYSGNVPSPPVGVPGQTAADERLEVSAAGAGVRSGQESGHADVPAGDGLGGNEPVPGNPLDPPADSEGVDLDTSHWSQSQPGSSSPLARGETGPLAPVAAEEDSRLRNASSAAQNLTDGQTRSLPGTVLPPDVSGVAASGGPAGEEPEAGTEGFSSADPAADFMATWRSFIRSFGTRDLIVIAPMLTDDEYGELEDDYTFLGQRLAKMRQS